MHEQVWRFGGEFSCTFLCLVRHVYVGPEISLDGVETMVGWIYFNGFELPAIRKHEHAISLDTCEWTVDTVSAHIIVDT